MTKHDATHAAQDYIARVWADDGAAVAATARQGLAEWDREELAKLHGEDADAVAEALVAECRERSA